MNDTCVWGKGRERLLQEGRTSFRNCPPGGDFGGEQVDACLEALQRYEDILGKAAIITVQANRIRVRPAEGIALTFRRNTARGGDLTRLMKSHNQVINPCTSLCDLCALERTHVSGREIKIFERFVSHRDRRGRRERIKRYIASRGM